MKLLLDSHALIWLYTGDDRLSDIARTTIEHSDNLCFLSLASIWEMSIKTKLGKMTLGVPLDRFIEDVLDGGISLLSIETNHILKTQEMTFHHRDPFDRLLFAQAIVENMALISADKIADAYFANEAVKRIG